MTNGRQITWENFRENFIEPGDPSTHVVDGQPMCELFVDRQAQRMGLRVAIKHSEELIELPYQNILTQLVQTNGNLCLEVSCNVQSLFEPFYGMILCVTDFVQLQGYSPSIALQECAQQFYNLISTHTLLSEEKEIGLWCELWVLEKLVRFRGTKAIQSWIGPLRESHDFRFDGVELEVKGTRLPRRSHLISSEDQLRPSVSSDLYLVSLQVVLAAGKGSSGLADCVTLITDHLASDPEMLAIFEALLLEYGYNRSHAYYYQTKYKLRTRPTLVPITDDTPRITAEFLCATLGVDKSTRLSEIKYRLDVTDLGFEEELEQFQEKLQTR